MSSSAAPRRRRLPSWFGARPINWREEWSGLQRVLQWLALTAVCLLVGVAVTATWPTTVQTSAYQATVRLSPSPDRIGVVHTSTVFGDLDLHFSGQVPAPGIDVDPQVRTDITKVLVDDTPTSVEALRPPAAELDAAVTRGVTLMATKFAAGALLAAVTAMLVVRALRRRSDATPRSLRRSAVVPGIAFVTSVALTAAGAASTYRPGQVQTIGTSGFVSVLRSNVNLLSSVQTRAVEATPYVKNVLALSSALQEKFTAPIGSDAPVKVLVVSDIHGANQYPLMKSIVETEGITAVIDCGDLVNFGRADEATAAGLTEGIASLGVPYLFVRGNHDASSPGDEQILNAVASVPNAIVLEPKEGSYTLADVAGLRIAGFNDPRWFGDQNVGAAEAQVPAAESFQAAIDALADGSARAGKTATPSLPGSAPPAPEPSETLGGRTSPTETPSASPSDTPAADPTAAAQADVAAGLDIAVGHEPAAVKPITGARLRLNGHLHSARLEGNRIGAGTFTGGGVAARYVPEKDGELTGQPYAFDILSFTPGCALTSLTRYTFRDIVEGRPVYDDIRVLNGASVQQPAPAEGRVCRPDLPLTVQPFTAAGAASGSASPRATG